jgi:hypothetical protein
VKGYLAGSYEVTDARPVACVHALLAQPTDHGFGPVVSAAAAGHISTQQTDAHDADQRSTELLATLRSAPSRPSLLHRQRSYVNHLLVALLQCCSAS